MKPIKSFIIILSSIIVFIIITNYLLYYNNKPYILPTINSVKTLNTDALIKKFRNKFQFVKNNSSFLKPLNHTQFNMLKNVNITNLNELAMVSLLLPNRELDYYPIIKLYPPVVDTLCMQLGQGSMGWYWIYGMDYKMKASFMFYIVRIDLFNNSELKKLNMSLGQGTIYYISCGYSLGKNNWKTTPYTVIPATFTCKDGMTQIKNGNNFEFNASKDGKISIKYIDENNNINFETLLTSREEPQFNGDNGCVPCYFGLGTNYWSYHNVEVTTLNLDGDSIDFKPTNKTEGWIDRQWIKTSTSQPFFQIIKNVFSNQITGLPKYVWLNLHMNNKQYIITFVPDDDYKKGDIMEATVLIFEKNKNRIDTTCSIKWAETSVIGGINYPIKYEITNLDKNLIILDGTYYGNGKCATLDNTNNLHYSGCGIITDVKGTKIGDGFLEANQFQNDKNYIKNSLSIIGLQNSVDEFMNSGVGIRKYLPLSIFIIWIVILILIIVFIVKFLKKRKN